MPALMGFRGGTQAPTAFQKKINLAATYRYKFYFS